jgi:hypothetical protein
VAPLRDGINLNDRNRVVYILKKEGGKEIPALLYFGVAGEVFFCLERVNEGRKRTGHH